MRLNLLFLFGLFLFEFSACKDYPAPKVSAEQSKLKAATDVFWALNDVGYVISKEKPLPSRHGCEPNEYLAKKGEALFRISVFDCGDANQAKTLVDDPKTQHVDSLLRNHHEGGILQRGPLEIIIRMNQGTAKDIQDLLDTVGAL